MNSAIKDAEREGRDAARNNSRAVVCPYRDEGEGDSDLLRQAWQRGYWRELADQRRQHLIRALYP